MHRKEKRKKEGKIREIEVLYSNKAGVLSND